MEFFCNCASSFSGTTTVTNVTASGAITISLGGKDQGHI